LGWNTNIIRMAARLSLLSTLLLTACSVVGVRSGTEEPAYTVIGHQGPAEIRQYAPRIAAETTVETTSEVTARGIGFRRLAGYIFGANTTKTSIGMTAPVAQSSEKIAMTAPVAQDRTPAGWTIRFFMPAEYKLDTLPEPKDPAVRLITVPGQTIAVVRFTGSTAPDAVARQQSKLLTALANGKWQAAGPPVVWFYDPPWTLPFLRRNEVAVGVQPAG
jgi:hypothetical protein